MVAVVMVVVANGIVFSVLNCSCVLLFSNCFQCSNYSVFQIPRCAFRNYNNLNLRCHLCYNSFLSLGVFFSCSR